MNKQPLTTDPSSALETAQQVFADWRKARTGRGRIPDHLWQTATDLYHIRGISINRIARGLRLNHSTLKAKLLETSAAAIEPPLDDASTLFIEVAPPPVCTDCIIEMENQTGVKMRMHFTGRADPAVIGLGRYLPENAAIRSFFRIPVRIYQSGANGHLGNCVWCKFGLICIVKNCWRIGNWQKRVLSLSVLILSDDGG